MKKILSIATIIVGILVVIIGRISNTKKCKSITVIGGADGPTSIFLAGKVTTNYFWMILGGLIIIVGVILFFVRKKK